VSARIVIVRPKQFTDMFRAYSIRLNGAEMGGVRRGGRLSFVGAAGPTSIEASIDWCKAPPLLLDLGEGEEAVVEVRNHFGLLRANYAISAGRDRYLELNLLSQG
jgi:hypothetical protein